MAPSVPSLSAARTRARPHVFLAAAPSSRPVGLLRPLSHDILHALLFGRGGLVSAQSTTRTGLSTWSKTTIDRPATTWNLPTRLRSMFFGASGSLARCSPTQSPASFGLLRNASTASYGGPFGKRWQYAQRVRSAGRDDKSRSSGSGSGTGSTSGPCPFDFDTRAEAKSWTRYMHAFDRRRYRRRQRYGLNKSASDTRRSIVRTVHPFARFRTGLVYFATTTGPQRGPRPSKVLGQPRSYFKGVGSPFDEVSTIAPIMSRSIARPSIVHFFRRTSLVRPPHIPKFNLARLLSSSRYRPSSTPPLEARESSLHLLFVPFATLLKSSAALNALTVVSRVALTVLPFSVRAKYFGSRNASVAGANAAKVISSAFNGASNSARSRTLTWGARYLAPFLAVMPLVLLGGIVLASLEQTPITGRWRTVMLSPSEESEMVASVLQAGETGLTNQRDWVTILRTVLELEQEGVSSSTGRRILLGGEVLDERDWRVRWTDAVLRALEQGVPALGQGDDGEGFSSDGPVLQPPPTRHPLRPRPTTESAAEMGWAGQLVLGKHVADSTTQGRRWDVEYELIVIDRAEANAFSFGFGPDEMDGSPDSRGRRGVIVVFTGFIDQILGDIAPSSQHAPTTTTTSSRPTLLSYFTGKREDTEPTIPNLVPTVLPTTEQTKALAVLLSHELSHLVLSHSVELHASTSLLLTHLSKLATDVVRTITFPLVAMLGPFLSDAINSSMKVGTSTSWGCLGSAMLACQSRKLETEADLVALRLLAHSGIDPNFALQFWEGRLERDQREEQGMHLHSVRAVMMSEENRKTACGLLSSHPVEEQRIESIRKELKRWEKYQEEERLLGRV